MATPLGKVSGLGSAKRGHRDLLAPARDRDRQHSARHLPDPLIVAHLGADCEVAFGAPLIALALLPLVISVPVHMRIGMQVVIEDYVHGAGASRLCSSPTSSPTASGRLRSCHRQDSLGA